jgi:hypothetical protein
VAVAVAALVVHLTQQVSGVLVVAAMVESVVFLHPLTEQQTLAVAVAALAPRQALQVVLAVPA